MLLDGLILLLGNNSMIPSKHNPSVFNLFLIKYMWMSLSWNNKNQLGTAETRGFDINQIANRHRSSA